MKKRDLVAIASAVGLLLIIPLGIQPAFAAATPSNCTQTWDTPHVGSGGLILGSGTGNCTTTASRTFEISLVHYFGSIFPDVTVTTSANGGSKKVYPVSYSICDNGGTSEFYNHAFFSGYSGGNSPHALFAHC